MIVGPYMLDVTALHGSQCSTVFYVLSTHPECILSAGVVTLNSVSGNHTTRIHMSLRQTMLQIFNEPCWQRNHCIGVNYNTKPGGVVK